MIDFENTKPIVSYFTITKKQNKKNHTRLESRSHVRNLYTERKFVLYLRL